MKGDYCWKLRKKAVKTKMFSETNEPEPSLQSEQAEPERHMQVEEMFTSEEMFSRMKSFFNTRKKLLVL